ncbi:MAG: transposase family protein [Chlamydiota bacterium]
MKMEVICDLDLYIWHFYFGLPGMLNDIDIMWLSPLMNSIKIGRFPPKNVKYTIDGQEFDWLYFLADGVYPRNFKIFISTLLNASSKKDKLFCKMQEGARKCVERVFAVLFKRFGILNVPGRLWSEQEMGYVIKTCVILHNMCIKERRRNIVGDGVGGLREDRIERELSGRYTNLKTHEKKEMLEAIGNRPSELYDDIDECERLTNALIENLSKLYDN